MDIIGYVFPIVAFLIFVLLISVPEYFGEKTGLWILKRRFRSEPQKIKLGRISGWVLSKLGFFMMIFACMIAVVVIIEHMAALGVFNIPEIPFILHLIYRSLLEQQLIEPVYTMVYSILLMTAFFVAGFVKVLLKFLWSRTQLNKDST